MRISIQLSINSISSRLGVIRQLALSNAQKTYLADEKLLRTVTKFASTPEFDRKLRHMRRVIREDILGKSYRCQRYLGKHGNVKKSEGQDYVDNVYEEGNSNSEVTLSIRHGKENIVIQCIPAQCCWKKSK